MCHERAVLGTVSEHEHSYGEMILRRKGWRFYGGARGPMICPACALRRAHQNAEITNQALHDDLEDLPF